MTSHPLLHHLAGTLPAHGIAVLRFDRGGDVSLRIQAADALSAVAERCGGAHHVGSVGGLLRVRVKTNRKDRDVVVLWVLGAEGCHEVVAYLVRGEACE